VGVCADGIQICDAEGSVEFGFWGSCEEDVRPAEELCDGLDNDCDGATDEDCPCEEGQSQACGVEFLIAPCTGGTQYCRSGAWTSCEGAVAPEAEACGSSGAGDGIDNDCDGETDELCGCDPSPEMCGDGYDNDCDGDIDEPACTTDIGTVGGDPPDAGGGIGTVGGDPPDAGGGIGTVGGDPPDAGSTGSCETDLPAPRLISPLSTSRVTTRTPTLEWELVAGIDGAAIQLCEDRACARVIETLEAAGTTAQPSSDLRVGVIYWRAVGLKRMSGDTTQLGCFSVPSMVSPTWEFFTNRRSAPRDASWGTVFDPNGDGYADLAVGVSCASGVDGCSPHLEIFHGGPSGLGAGPEQTIPAPSADNVYFGSRVTPVGDLNGDGFADLAEGWPAYSFTEADVGSVFIYFGGAGGMNASPDITLSGVDSANELTFGADVDGVGDVNRDGYADIIVGTGLQMERAEAYLFLGGPDGPTATRTVLEGPGVRHSHGFGTYVAGAGDVNADGFGDVAIGCLGDIWLFLGRPTGIRLPADQVVEGAVGNELIGMGDVNGDGYADVASQNLEGWRLYRIYVHHGNASGLDARPATTLRHEGDGDVKTQFGWNLASLDVNGDGYWDLAAGLNFVQEVRLFYGSPSGIVASPYVNFEAEENGSYGTALGGGDVDGDQDEDFLVGARAAPFFSHPAGPGTVYQYDGDPAGVSRTPSKMLRGETVRGGFGGAFGSAVGGG